MRPRWHYELGFTVHRCEDTPMLCPIRKARWCNMHAYDPISIIGSHHHSCYVIIICMKLWLMYLDTDTLYEDVGTATVFAEPYSFVACGTYAVLLSALLQASDWSRKKFNTRASFHNELGCVRNRLGCSASSGLDDTTFLD